MDKIISSIIKYINGEPRIFETSEGNLHPIDKRLIKPEIIKIKEKFNINE